MASNKNKTQKNTAPKGVAYDANNENDGGDTATMTAPAPAPVSSAPRKRGLPKGTVFAKDATGRTLNSDGTPRKERTENARFWISMPQIRNGQEIPVPMQAGVFYSSRDEAEAAMDDLFEKHGEGIKLSLQKQTGTWGGEAPKVQIRRVIRKRLDA